jgi:hypothetical protein
MIILLVGFVTSAYNVQVGMGIVAATVILMIIALCLRIIGVCPDYNMVWTDSPIVSARPPRPIQKQEYVLVSNPDLSISIGTRTFPSQPSSAAYPPPY